LLIIFTASFSAAQSGPQETVLQGAPAFSISRFLIAGRIENREPVGVANTFSASTEKVYCFLEAGNIAEDTKVRFVSYHGDDNVAEIELMLGKGPKWRTNASKKLGGRTGDWKVDLQDADGNVLDSAAFTVE
jgi:hypothetical protein